MFKVYATCVCGCGKRASIKSAEPIKDPPPYHHSRIWRMQGAPRPGYFRRLWNAILGR